MISQVYILIAAAAVMFSVIGGLSLLAHYYTLNGIKSRTVGMDNMAQQDLLPRMKLKAPTNTFHLSQRNGEEV